MAQTAIWAPYRHPEALWYAVHTRSRHEDAVHKRLADKAVAVFLPKMEVWSRRVDRRKRIRVPMFPGYLFVKGFMDKYLCSEIVRTSGVVRVLGNSQGVVPVPEAQIESVRSLLVNNVLPTPHAYLQVGRRVRVVAGPLTGCEGILLEKKDRNSRLVISVDIIKQAVAVEIDSADVEPV